MSKTAIIDCDSIAFSVFIGNKVLDNYGIPIKENGKFVYVDKTEQEMKDSADYLFNKIFKDTKCTHYIAYIKGKNTIADRLKYNPTYKQDRTSEQPKWWEFVKNDLVSRYNAVVVDNREVDDAVNITRLHLPNSFICCIDSDLLSQQGTHFNWRKAEWITTSKEEEQYTFWSDMICGTHNNVTGLKGKGVKYVEKLFNTTLGRIPFDMYKGLVLQEYIKHYGDEEIAIDEFYRTYKSLKLKTRLEDFIIPTPVEVELKSTKYASF